MGHVPARRDSGEREPRDECVEHGNGLLPCCIRETVVRSARLKAEVLGRTGEFVDVLCVCCRRHGAAPILVQTQEGRVWVAVMSGEARCVLFAPSLVFAVGDAVLIVGTAARASTELGHLV